MQHSKKYKLIADKLIRDLPEFKDIRDTDVKIAYLASDEEKRKNRKIVFADCNLVSVSKRYKWCCEYDFFIVVYEPNIELFTDKQVEILLRYELHHVGIDFESNENKYYIVLHDVEEFWEIIKDNGLRWCEMDAERRNNWLT